ALNAAPVGGQWRVRAAGKDNAYQIFLDADYTLRRVVFESATGLGSGLEVQYSDFALLDKISYPKTMVIKFSAQQQHGLELHFRDAAFPNKIADKEFRR